uniref:Uncharacterized protein n=1 Tax=Tanacetum cinerariifolium TaxID=118510 RepID=A0A6L2P276_TANCI|nr:hypothetical protein [Tanacetum cinerariifolium]
MSTQQDIYAAGSENRPPMLNKDNYVPWSSHLLRYAQSKPNRKLLVNSIKNVPYVRRMIHKPGDPNGVPPVDESTHEQTNNKLTNKEVKQMKVDDQAIQTILTGLPEDIYDAVDSYDTTKKIWLRVEYMMKGSSIEVQEKKAKNKHFLETIAGNLKFLNNIQPKWKQSVTTVHQTKDLHIVDYIQLYDFLEFNQAEVDAIRAEKLARTHDPLRIGLLCQELHSQTRRRDVAYLESKLLIAQIKEARIQLQAEFDLMATAEDIDVIEEVNANCILMENLQQASKSGTQTDKAPIYDSDEIVEVH